MPAPVYNSINEFPGDGVTTQYEFNFAGGYISRDHVRAYTTDALGVITEVVITDPMWVNDNTLDLGVAAPVGGITRIYRDTPRDQPLVNFSTGSRFTEANLDLLARQTVLGVAEAFDAGAYAAANDLLGAAGAALAAAQQAEANAADSETAAGLSAVAASAARIAAEAAQLAAEAARDDPAVQTVYTNIADISAVAGSIANVNAVGPIAADVSTVAGIAPAVSTVAGIAADVSIVADAAPDIAAAVADLPALAAKVSKTGDTMAGNLTVPSLNGGQLAGHRNKLIGNFLVNQRALTSVADDTYCLDRWYVLTETGNVTVAQVTDPESGAPFGIRLTQPDASPKRIGIAQIIESQNIRQYASQAMNFFARVKLSASTGIRYAIIEHTGTADVVTSDVVNNWASTTFTPSNFFIAGINILKTGVVTPGAAAWGEIDDWSALGAGVKNVVLFVWSESALAQNATLEINRPQYEPGVVATPYEWRLNEITLARRYYQKYFDLYPVAYQSAGGVVRFQLPLSVPMRAAPTVVADTVDAVNATTFTTSFISDSVVNYQWVATALGTTALRVVLGLSSEL